MAGCSGGILQSESKRKAANAHATDAANGESYGPDPDNPLPTELASGPAGTPWPSSVMATATQSVIARTTAPVPTVALPDLTKVNGADPVAVSQMVLTVMYTEDAAVDSGPWDAELRAVPLLTPQYANDLKSSRPVQGPGYQWLLWAQHKVHTVPTLTVLQDGERPSDTPTQAIYAFRVSVNPVATDGWFDVPQAFAAYVTLNRSDATQPWRVSQVQIQ